MNFSRRFALLASVLAAGAMLSSCAVMRGQPTVKYDVSMNFGGAGFVERKYCRAPENSLEWDCFTEKCANAEGLESCHPLTGNPDIRRAYLKQSGAAHARNAAEELDNSRLDALKKECAGGAIESCVEYYDSIRIDRARAAEMNELREKICADPRVRCEEKRSSQALRVRAIPGCKLETLRALPEIHDSHPDHAGGFQIVDLGAKAPERACDAVLEEFHRQRTPIVDAPLAKGEKLLVRREQWTVNFPKKKSAGTLSTRVERIVLKRSAAGPKPASAPVH